MLINLTIKDIVLIEALSLEFKAGLSILTGETGAGKSILLDALSFALGSRGDAGLVRKGQAQGSVSAVFSLPPFHPAFAQLIEADLEIEAGEDIIIRRTQFADGRTRALVNEQAISAQGLKQLGSVLVEINGQHDTRGLMDEKFHVHLLDMFGNYPEILNEMRSKYEGLKTAQKALKQHEEALIAAQRDQDYQQAVFDELSSLNPQIGEEEALSIERTRMMQAEKIMGDLGDAFEELSGNNAPTAAISSVMRRLERKNSDAFPQLAQISEMLGQSLDLLNTASDELHDVLRDINFNPRVLEETEERLFAIRGAARKHKVTADKLPEVLVHAQNVLDNIQSGEAELKKLNLALETAHNEFETCAKTLTQARTKAANALEAKVMQELPALKLERAAFKIAISPSTPSVLGVDDISFQVQTNPGAGFAGLSKIASGGELSRFLLGLKVALAEVGSASTLIFDEIDTGVGGAVAAAMGARLKSLSGHLQVLAITHAPQVAACALEHFHISKTSHGVGQAERVFTSVQKLNIEQRREELARMLSGEHITPEARAAADTLLALHNGGSSEAA